jgi:hypothetical protein
MRRHWWIAAALVLTGCGATGAEGSLDTTEMVCYECAAYARDGMPAEQRAEVDPSRLGTGRGTNWATARVALLLQVKFT